MARRPEVCQMGRGHQGWGLHTLSSEGTESWGYDRPLRSWRSQLEREATSWKITRAAKRSFWVFRKPKVRGGLLT